METNNRSKPISYRILDANGRVVGRVETQRPPALGPGAGTVLLLRDCQRARAPALA
jgi:hypothetical protein